VNEDTRLWIRESLDAARVSGDPVFAAARAALRDAAAEALRVAPTSVTDKATPAPSGDPRDYRSIGPYWWPNPDTADGLPYVRRDGEVNPERYADNSERLKRVESAVTTLGLAAWLFAEESYAAHAAALLRAWFLDPDTGMNPHLEYAQAIPGICEGRDIGVIDTHRLPEMLDAVCLLHEAFPQTWSDGDHTRLRAWFSALLDWLLTSEKGRGESGQHNNHGTWYDVQAAYYARFTGRDGVARSVLAAAAERRIRAHISEDGAQPHELARTRSLSYSAMNLHGLFDLATLAEPLGIDLWGVGGETEKEPLLSRALRYLWDRADDWQQPQIVPVDARDLLLSHILRGARVWPGTGHRELAREIGPAGHRAFLIYAPCGAPPVPA